MKSKMTRRDMLRITTLAGVGVMSVSDSFARKGNLLPSSQENAIRIPTRVLGRTGMELPILSMGVNRADNPNVLRAAYNSGIWHFDTGYAYQNGKSEEMMGNILGDKPRESLNIATKAMFDYPLKDNFEELLFEHLETSLRRMKIDYVDIFYAHSISSIEKLTDPRVLAALQKIKDSGKARFLGFSSHNQKNELLEAAIDCGVYDVAMVTYNFKIEKLEETEAVISKAVNAGMGVIAMKVMAGGVEDSVDKKKIDGKACLKWIWQNENITTVLPSVANYDELDSCFEAVAEFNMTEDERNYLEKLRPQATVLCRQCESCMDQCPKQVPIPDIMRAYMYAYGYKNPRLSKEALQLSGISGNVCADCIDCQVECPAGFSIHEKITAVTKVLAVPDEFLA